MVAPLPRVRLAAPEIAPLVRVNTLVTVSLLESVTPAALLTVRLLKVVVPFTD
jgi:hypothetical protein